MGSSAFGVWPVAALVAQLAVGSAVAADRYTALEISPPGGTVCFANGVNASGQVVGTINTDLTGQAGRGFVTGPNGAGVRLIDTLGGDQSTLAAINDDGRAVGSATTVNNASRNAILVEPGTSTPIDLGGMGGKYSGASDINKKGRVVGGAQLPDQTFAGFITAKGSPQTMVSLGQNNYAFSLTDDGTVVGESVTGNFTGSAAFITGPNATGMRQLASLGGSMTYATSVNRNKEVVGAGSSPDGTSTHGFVTDADGANLRDLGVPGMVVVPAKINNKGMIVGTVLNWPAAVPQYAFLATRFGKYWDLNSLVALGQGRILWQASGINDKGQIAATSTDNKCYLLTPVER